jgi:hypothetical protein
MKLARPFLFLALSLSTLSLAACSGSSADDAASPETAAASADQDLTKALGPGHYQLVSDDGLSGVWIIDLTLHHDGTYDALFGTDISNVSGHQFNGQGHYHLANFRAGPSIVFEGGGGWEFTYAAQSDGTFHVRTLNSLQDLQTRFVIKKTH